MNSVTNEERKNYNGEHWGHFRRLLRIFCSFWKGLVALCKMYCGMFRKMAKGRVTVHDGPTSARERRGRKRNGHTKAAMSPWLGMVTMEGYAYKLLRRGGTLHTSLVKFNPGSVAGEKTGT